MELCLFVAKHLQYTASLWGDVCTAKSSISIELISGKPVCNVRMISIYRWVCL